MRPFQFLALILIVLLAGDLLLFFHYRNGSRQRQSSQQIRTIVTAGLGLTDLCVATEARYTRHPAVSDPVSPFMDHPGAIEHFPTGTFWSAVPPTK